MNSNALNCYVCKCVMSFELNLPYYVDCNTASLKTDTVLYQQICTRISLNTLVMYLVISYYSIMMLDEIIISFQMNFLKLFKHSFLNIAINIAIWSPIDAHYLKEKILYPQKYVSKHLRKKYLLIIVLNR